MRAWYSSSRGWSTFNPAARRAMHCIHTGTVSRLTDTTSQFILFPRGIILCTRLECDAVCRVTCSLGRTYATAHWLGDGACIVGRRQCELAGGPRTGDNSRDKRQDRLHCFKIIVVFDTIMIRECRAGLSPALEGSSGKKKVTTVVAANAQLGRGERTKGQQLLPLEELWQKETNGEGDNKSMHAARSSQHRVPSGKGREACSPTLSSCFLHTQAEAIPRCSLRLHLGGQGFPPASLLCGRHWLS